MNAEAPKRERKKKVTVTIDLEKKVENSTPGQIVSQAIVPIDLFPR